MLTFHHQRLSNGLTVLFLPDPHTPFASVNVLYDVGAKDEDPQHTGFAHLFEHLMFGGSANVPSYDSIVNGIGGENNAFTNNDYTNYYLSVPKDNLATALWVEADRMQSLLFSQERLEVQRKVVIEEYKQRYYNQPYGDIWLLLRPIAYQTHPYQWCTIGKDIASIEQATLPEVEDFFNRFYMPNNAFLSIAGDFQWESVLEQVEQFFGAIPSRPRPARRLPVEPLPLEHRSLHVERDVPADALIKAFPMCHRLHQDYYAFDILSDVLCNGNSSLLYAALCDESPLFTEIDAFITGDIDNGLLVISGKLSEGVSMNEAEAALMDQLLRLTQAPLSDRNLQKVKNIAESNRAYSQVKSLDKAMNLCYFGLLGSPAMINHESECYDRISVADMQRIARLCFVEQNHYTLYYHRKQS